VWSPEQLAEDANTALGLWWRVKTKVVVVVVVVVAAAGQPPFPFLD